MTAALMVLGLGLLPLAVILLARWADACAWRRSLVAFRLQPPMNLSADEVSVWLSTISAMTHPARFALLPLPPVCFEVVSTARGVSFYVLVTRTAEATLLSGLRASMPGARITEAPEYVAAHPGFQVAAEATMTSHDRPLAVARTEAASAALLASLQPVIGDGTAIRMQWILTSAGTPLPVPTANASTDASPVWAWENTVPEDAEAVQAARAKQRDPLLLGVARLGVDAPNKAQAYVLLSRVWNNLHLLNAPGVRLRRRWLPSAIVADRLRQRAYPITRWPLRVSSREGAGLLALPIGGVRLPGVAPMPGR